MDIKNYQKLQLPEELNSKILEKNLKFVVTGASGWLGKALLEILYFCFKHKLPEYVIALSNSESIITLRNGYEVVTNGYDYKFHNLPDVKDVEYALFHFAFLTKDKILTLSDDEYKKQNYIIRQYVSKIINQIKPYLIFYSSSGAVYDKNDLYGILKLEDEIYFQSLANDIKAQMIIPRIFNIAGPYINKQNIYAISDFINQLIKNQQIIIKSDLPVIRSYIHILDLFKICFYWLLDDKKQEKSITFDTGNYHEIELFDLAKIMVKLINPQAKIIKNQYDESDISRNYYVGNIEVQEKLCKKYNLALGSYQEIILDTYQYLK